MLVRIVLASDSGITVSSQRVRCLERDPDPEEVSFYSRNSGAPWVRFSPIDCVAHVIFAALRNEAKGSSPPDGGPRG